MTSTIHVKKRCGERGIRPGQVQIVVEHGTASVHPRSGFLIYTVDRRQARTLERKGRRAGVDPQLLSGIGKLTVVVDPLGRDIITAYRAYHH